MLRPACDSKELLSLGLSNTQGSGHLPLLPLGFLFSLTEKQTGNFIDCLGRLGVVLKASSLWGLFGGPRVEPLLQCRKVGCWNPPSTISVFRDELVWYGRHGLRHQQTR